MDFNSISGVLRAVVPSMLAYAVGKGWITQSSVGDITSAAVAIAAALWSIQSNRPTKS
jgi:hypothetical protein